MLLGKGLAGNGTEVLFVATHSGEARSYTAEGLEVRSLVGWRKAGWKSHEDELEQTLRHFEPDICYVRVFEELEVMTRVCRKMGVPIVSMSCTMRETSPILQTPRAQDIVAHFRSFLSIRSVAVHVSNTLEVHGEYQSLVPPSPKTYDLQWAAGAGASK